MIYEFEIETQKGIGYYDITQRIIEIVNESGISEGLCNIFLPATTAGIVINENDIMLLQDFKRMFLEIADDKRAYSHENAPSHLKASLIKTGISIPLLRGKLMLGKWQSIFLWEFDTSMRKRKVIVTLLG